MARKEFCNLTEEGIASGPRLDHDRPHRGVESRTPHEAFLSFAADLNPEVLTV
jgi:hypothetical protein